MRDENSNQMKTEDESPDRDVDAYLTHLLHQQTQTPAYLKQQIINAVRQQPRTLDALSWLSEVWWRMVVTTAAPLAVGLFLGWSSPEVIPLAPENLLFADDYLSIANDYYLSIDDTVVEIQPDE